MRLKKQFSDLYEEIRIKDESRKLKEKREILQSDIEEKFPEEMEKNGILLNKSDIEMFDQGSYKYNTTIKSPVIDRDVAIKIPLDIEKNDDPRKIKEYLYNVLNSISARKVNFKEPCITVPYHENNEEWMHIDLPLYAEYEEELYLARGKKYGEYKWEKADPKGLNTDLCSKINGNDQLRRIIRFLKKWKMESYKNSTLDNEVPPSIGITYLACDCFIPSQSSEGDNDLEALQKTVEKILSKFSVGYDVHNNLISAKINRDLPVEPYIDIFTKFNNSPKYGITFYKRLKKALENLNDAMNAEDDNEAGKYVQKVFGEEFIVPEKEQQISNNQEKKEQSFG